MLDALIRWSLRRRYLVLILAFISAGVGLWALSRLNKDAFPDTTPVQVQINTVASSLVPEEIELQITYPIELALSGLKGLQEVRSISLFGLSQVVVTFEDGTDIYFARQLITQKLGEVKLPDGVDRPDLGPVSTGLGEVFHYLVSSPDVSLTDLRTIHDKEIKPALRPVPGTAEVNSWGGLEKQYQIRIDPNRLVKYDVGFEQVVKAVKANNLNVGGGNLDRGGDMLLVHGIGRTSNVEQLRNIVVAAKDGVPIRIRELAEVTIGHEIRRGAITADGKGEAVLGLGFMLMGENSYDVTRRMKAKFAEVKADVATRHPTVALETVYDRTELVDFVLETVRHNLLEGALLVIVILYLFLGNLRAGLMVALAIPLSMLFAFSGMLQIGIAATLLSLGAIDFGIVVDSSVVVIENVVHRLGHCGGSLTREAKLQLVGDAAIEVKKPTVFGQLIIMIVYLPILTLEGVEGKMFRPMALTVMLVLTGSLIVSLTLMPVLAYFLLSTKAAAKDPLLVRAAVWIYRGLLGVALRFRVAVMGLALATLGLATVVALGLGSEFLPRLAEGAIVVGVNRMPGTSINESVRLDTEMEQLILKSFPDEVEHVWNRVGSPEVATDASGVEQIDFFITLKPRHHWKKATTQAQLVELMAKQLDEIPGQYIWFTQPIEQRINEMISGVRSDIALKLFGDDFDTLVSTARKLEAVLRTVDGNADLATEQIDGQPVLRIKVRQDQLARYGVAAETVLDLIESIGGKPVGEVIEGQLRFPLVVRLPEQLRASPESIQQILVATAAGELIPLSRLADVVTTEGPKAVSREWSKRRITVTCNVRGRDIGSFVAEAQRKIAATVQLPLGYRTEWGGQFENLERARSRLLLVVPAALALIFGLLYLTYRNLVDAAALFASVPFAAAGGLFALWYRDLPFSISAGIGFITLSGVSVLSSMVFVSAFRQLQLDGVPTETAIREAAVARLRTILMTALVASVGFFPMAASIGMGAEVQRPLATVVIGGVVSSTLMTLFALPGLYRLLGGWAEPVRESVPPAAA